MDSRQVKTPKYMVYCVFVSCIGSFCNGWTIGCSNLPGEVTHACPSGSAHLANPALPDCLPMSTSLWGFAVASFCVGGLIGGLTGGAIQTRLGRKKTIIFNTAGWLVGGILLGLSANVAMFIIGRVLCGLSCGLGSLAIPTYIGETSSIRARGAMGTLNQFFIVIGILLSSVVGLPMSNVPLWRVNFAIVGIPAAIQALLMTTSVESPRWLVTQNRIREARHALQRLRGPNADISNEFYEILEGQVGPVRARSLMDQFDPGNAISEKPASTEIDKVHDPETGSTVIDPGQELRKTMNIMDVFRDPVIRRMSIIVLTHHAIQQLSGMNAVMYYSTSIFRSAFNAQMSKYMAIATAGVNFVFTMVTVLFVDRMGRRPLLMLAETGASVFSVLLVIGYRFNAPALLVVSVLMYVASFAIGIGPIPWMITSELTPSYANSSVGAAATAVNWGANFLIGQVFPVIFEAIQGYSFVIFAVTCFCSFAFTFFMLPETKNRSIESIVRGFELCNTRAST